MARLGMRRFGIGMGWGHVTLSGLGREGGREKKR